MNEEKKETVEQETIKTIKIPVGEKVAEESSKKYRQIILETDGNDVRIVKAETAGNIELGAIMQMVIDFLKKKQHGTYSSNR